MNYDFSGWATRNNIKCSDGRIIMKDAFKQNDGQKVPLVWNHQHDSPNEVLGHAILENRDDGVYAYCTFNDTESGQQAKALVQNGDVDKLSIYANKLKSQMNNVIHGCIREVSLVLAGANPGAYIDSVITHGEGSDLEEEAIIYTEELISVFDEMHEESIEHNDESEKESDKEGNEKMEDEENNKEIEHAESEEKTVGKIFEEMTDEQKDAVYAIVGKALEDTGVSEEDEENKGEEENMKHNVFEKEKEDDAIMHSEILADALADVKKYGSLRDSVIEHAALNNITDIGKLFPDATPLNKEPYMIEKDQSWVAKVMRDVKHSPFSRVKMTYGRMTEPQARAKGYIKGNKKVDIQMAVLNRTTSPTTVYIKNSIDRDDVIDITDFDVVAWQKKEMRKELDKELARAFLLGDGRNVSDEYKINELNIRPILTDDDMFTIKYTITEGRDYNQTGNSQSENDSFTKGIVRAALRARKEYKGSGKPTFFTTEDYLTDMLLIEDQNGRAIYESEEKLKTALRVDEIVTIPEMEEAAYSDVVAVIVNMNDYTSGADKGGSVSLFDDFDIDYNQMKYLMETRCSGSLTKPYSAIVLKKASSNQANQPAG